MTTRYEDLTDEQVAGLSAEEFDALVAGGGAAAAEGDDDPPSQPAAPEVAPEPEPAPSPAAAPAPAPAAPDPARYAELEEQHRQLLAALSDPARVRQHLAALDPTFGQPAAPVPAQPEPAAPVAPSWDEDPDAALAYVVQNAIQQATAPLVSELQTLKERDAQREAQEQHRTMMMTMASKHGPDFETTLQAFDAANPHLKDYHPEVRYMAAFGLKAKTAPPPQADPADLDARIAAKAEELLAQRLAGGKPVRGVPTLGGVTPGQADETLDPEKVDYARMNLDEMLQFGRKAFGGT